MFFYIKHPFVILIFDITTYDPSDELSCIKVKPLILYFGNTMDRVFSIIMITIFYNPLACSFYVLIIVYYLRRAFLNPARWDNKVEISERHL